MTSQHTIAGTVLTMPVRVRTATQHTAMFAVDADATQRMIDYSGLQVYRPLPGRAIVTLIMTHFVDSDLGAYHEYSTCVSVNPPGSKPGLRSLQTAFVHQMFVDQSFTLEAGRTIWGFPKVMADYDIRDGRQFGFDARIDGQLVIGMEFSPGVKLPAAASRQQELSSYSCLDGVRRESRFEMVPAGVRMRPGGARVWLGDHPFAKELAALGLPKRALVSNSSENVAMTFGDAREV
ncbi:acetoacetate decarboxylase family protein [Mycolicibacterium celeriflavum]|uniref:acetoacetate decarboxylase family protein n=1 Tax=Mycolicibacterium celeriflavum TaxID=1249101 RepID=UPI003CFB025C